MRPCGRCNAAMANNARSCPTCGAEVPTGPKATPSESLAPASTGWLVYDLWEAFGIPIPLIHPWAVFILLPAMAVMAACGAIGYFVADGEGVYGGVLIAFVGLLAFKSWQEHRAGR